MDYRGPEDSHPAWCRQQELLAHRENLAVQQALSNAWLKAQRLIRVKDYGQKFTATRLES